MATVIESDLNRYEVVKVLNPDNQVLNVSLTTSPSDPKPTNLDAFGRLRISQPLTLFDSSHRFSDNGLWNTATTSSGAAAFNANEGLVDLNVTGDSGSEVLRETTKVFSYQPGKSLLILNTFVFNAAKTNLRQRVGYFGSNNGIYLQLNNSTLSFVERTSVTGSVTETVVDQTNWNIDKLDGNGPSGMTLNIEKAQILWMDVEWLGLGTVRTGFVIDGKFIHCHSFHHANLISSTYITTASLPCRYEITNTAATGSSSTLKQVCSSVISEGGYQLFGEQKSVGLPITTPRNLTVSGTFYPIISLRLKTTPNRLDAIVILTAISLMGVGNNGFFNWQIRASSVTSGGLWVTTGADSAVDYNFTGTSVTGGRVLASGFISSTTQSNSPIDILKEALFKFQLERDTFTSTPHELSLVVSSLNANDDMYASLDWEEISR